MSRTVCRFEKANLKPWQGKRDLSGWLLCLLNKLPKFKHGLAPSAQLFFLPGFSYGKNNNKTLYCNAECNVHNVRIHCIYPSQEKHGRGLDLGWAPGLGYRQTLWVCLGFFCWSLMQRAQVCKKEAFSESQKLLRTRRQAVASGQKGHRHAGQTRKPRMTYSSFSAGQQKQLIKAGGQVMPCILETLQNRQGWTCLWMFVKLLESEEEWKYACAGKGKAFGSPHIVLVVFSWIVLNILGISGEEENLQDLTFQELFSFLTVVLVENEIVQRNQFAPFCSLEPLLSYFFSSHNRFLHLPCFSHSSERKVPSCWQCLRLVSVHLWRRADIWPALVSQDLETSPL